MLLITSSIRVSMNPSLSPFQIIEKSGNPSSDRGFVILRFVQFVQVFQGITILLLSVLTKRRGSYKGMDQTTVRNAMAVLNRKSTVLQTVL